MKNHVVKSKRRSARLPGLLCRITTALASSCCKGSRRALAIPPYIKRLIDAVDGDVIVPLTASAISKRFWRLLDKAGLPHMAYHKLRHINASVMADLQIPDAISNERGGWATDYVRKRVYTHTFPASRIDADKQIDQYFDAIVNAHFTNEFTNDIKKPPK